MTKIQITQKVAQRSLLYLAEKSLNHASYNMSRGMVMDQLLKFMGEIFVDF
jgi:hypothetical protein